MILVEFRLDHPILRRAMDRVPEMELTWERSDAIDESRVRLLVWAEGGDFDAFERAMEDDPTVETPSRVIRVGDRRLYQTELAGEGLAASIYPLLVEEGGVIEKLTATTDGWEFRVAFGSRASFDRFYAFCRERDIGFEFHRLYEARDGADSPGYGLTERQRETLVGAVDLGYFEIPRDCTLAELGLHLGVSETAASERIRRAMKTLVVQTVYRDPPAS
jgi:predicted DNA binding protein